MGKSGRSRGWRPENVAPESVKSTIFTLFLKHICEVEIETELQVPTLLLRSHVTAAARAAPAAPGVCVCVRMCVCVYLKK
jgi:hypothetical protein